MMITFLFNQLLVVALAALAALLQAYLGAPPVMVALAAAALAWRSLATPA